MGPNAPGSLNRTRVSIALCTHNGARFLSDQLTSLAAQSELPEELVACDDASEDGTLDELAAFAGRAPFSVRVFPAQSRLGPAQNFARAIGLCTGDVIALADQDDVWAPDRLAVTLDRFQADPAIGAVFSNADVVDEKLRPLGYTMWQHVGFTPGEREAMEQGDALSVLLKHYVVTGATMAFRAELRTCVLPIPEGWYHDAWIAMVAGAVSRIGAIPRALMRYRQHGMNVIGGRFQGYVPQAMAGLRVGRDAYYQREIRRFRGLRDRLGEIGDARLRSNARELVQAKLDHLEARAHLPKNRLLRLSGVLRQLANGSYARFSKDWRSVAVDLFFP